MMNELIKKFESGEIDILDLLEQVKEVEYRLNEKGQFKSVSLKFEDGEQLNSYYGAIPSIRHETVQPTDETLATIALIYEKKLDFMRR